MGNLFICIRRILLSFAVGMLLFTTLNCMALAQDDDQSSGSVEILTLDTVSVQPCVVHLPAGYDPEKQYPLVIGLHGHASNIDRYHTNWYAFDDPQFIYACPQAPYPSIQPYGLGFSWFLVGSGDAELELKVIGLTNDYMVQTVNRLTSEYNVSDIYLLGFSQGAMLGLLLCMENPDLISGIGFLSARLDPWLGSEQMLSKLPDGLRVFGAHGTRDQDVTIAEGRAARDLLENAGLEVTYIEFEGEHTILADTLREFQEWMIE